MAAQHVVRMGSTGGCVLFAASVLTTFPTLASGGVALPADNSRMNYRQGSDFFGRAWPPPQRIDGEAPTPEKPTDVQVHSFEGEEHHWVDYLYPFEFEKSFMSKAVALSAFCRSWWWAAPAAVSMYLPLIWKGTSVMSVRKPYDLKRPLAVWNLLLAVFSFIGTARTLPHLLLMWHRFGFEYTLCRAAWVGYGCGSVGLWTALFIFSKYAELIDTMFLVLRKKNVGFLHWYHHCSVLLYCWHAYITEMPTGIYFVTMNYSVHAVMYFYYFLAAVCAKPPKWALFVTILQLAQMAGGITITLVHLQILLSGSVRHCDGYIPNLTGALTMYASYFVLFAQFLLKRYCQPRAPANGMSKKTK